jgi:YcxB-like protein
MSPVTLRYRLGRLDVTAWILSYMLRSPVGWIVVLIATALRCWVLFRDGLAQSIPLLAWHGTLTLLMAWCAFVTSTVLFSLLQRPAALGLEADFTIHAEGFTSESSLGRSELKWSAVRSIRTGPWHTFLYVSSSQAIILPNRAFTDVAARKALVEACRGFIAASRAQA